MAAPKSIRILSRGDFKTIVEVPEKDIGAFISFVESQGLPRSHLSSIPGRPGTATFKVPAVVKFPEKRPSATIKQVAVAVEKAKAEQPQPKTIPVRVGGDPVFGIRDPIEQLGSSLPDLVEKKEKEQTQAAIGRALIQGTQAPQKEKFKPKTPTETLPVKTPVDRRPVLTETRVFTTRDQEIQAAQIAKETDVLTRGAFITSELLRPGGERVVGAAATDFFAGTDEINKIIGRRIVEETQRKPESPIDFTTRVTSEFTQSPVFFAESLLLGGPLIGLGAKAATKIPGAAALVTGVSKVASTPGVSKIAAGTFGAVEAGMVTERVVAGDVPGAVGRAIFAPIDFGAAELGFGRTAVSLTKQKKVTPLEVLIKDTGEFAGLTQRGGARSVKLFEEKVFKGAEVDELLGKLEISTMQRGAETQRVLEGTSFRLPREKPTLTKFEKEFLQDPSTTQLINRIDRGFKPGDGLIARVETGKRIVRPRVEKRLTTKPTEPEPFELFETEDIFKAIDFQESGPLGTGRFTGTQRTTAIIPRKTPEPAPTGFKLPKARDISNEQFMRELFPPTRQTPRTPKPRGATPRTRLRTPSKPETPTKPLKPEPVVLSTREIAALEAFDDPFIAIPFGLPGTKTPIQITDTISQKINLDVNNVVPGFKTAFRTDAGSTLLTGVIPRTAKDKPRDFASDIAMGKLPKIKQIPGLGAPPITDIITTQGRKPRSDTPVPPFRIPRQRITTTTRQRPPRPPKTPTRQPPFRPFIPRTDFTFFDIPLGKPKKRKKLKFKAAPKPSLIGVFDFLGKGISIPKTSGIATGAGIRPVVIPKSKLRLK